jgi:uncharacterized protein YoxC
VDTILTAAQVIALLSLAGLAIYAIVVLTKVHGILGDLRSDINKISLRIVPVLDNLEAITSKVRTLAESLDDQITIVRDAVESIRTISENVLDFERRIRETVEEPVLEVAGVLASIVRTIAAFIRRFRG